MNEEEEWKQEVERFAGGADSERFQGGRGDKKLKNKSEIERRREEGES